MTAQEILLHLQRGTAIRWRCAHCWREGIVFAHDNLNAFNWLKSYLAPGAVGLEFNRENCPICSTESTGSRPVPLAPTRDEEN